MTVEYTHTIPSREVLVAESSSRLYQIGVEHLIKSQNERRETLKNTKKTKPEITTSASEEIKSEIKQVLSRRLRNI